jgi:deoxyribonuclease-1-like protein
MKKILILVLLLFAVSSFSQTKILSWNLANFGKSKSESELNFIANTLLHYDIITIQEVVAGYGGAQAVAKLAASLNQKGTKWDYIVSDPTSTGPTSNGRHKTERYAYLWKTNKAKLKGKAWLENKYGLEIEREPYFATFEINKKAITLVTYHAITKNKQPETEIKYFKLLPPLYPNLNLVFIGDFNCPQSHSVFTPLKKMGYVPILQNQKTSLKQMCKNNVCLASEFDNIFYKTNTIQYTNSGIIPFYTNFSTLKEARKISDHVPVWFEFSMN